MAEGDLLIEVELGPVFAIEGETPLIRELSSGSVGKDVLTLQRFLEREGHLLIDPDGKFGPGTVRGVKEWQQSVGLKRSGSIEVGQFVVLPDLPSDIRLIESVGVGKHVVLGEDFLEIIDPTPRYSSPLLDGQRALIELPAQVISRSGDTRIEAVGANFATTVDGVVLHLENAKTTCTGVCVGDLSAGEDLILSAEVVVLQPESGVIVPLSAIVVDGSGTPKLVMEDGSLRDIEIGNRDAGYAIVSGVADGERVRALGR